MAMARTLKQRKNRRKTGGVLAVSPNPREVYREADGWSVFPDVRYYVPGKRMTNFQVALRFSNKKGSDRWRYNQFLKQHGFMVTMGGDIVKSLPGKKFRMLTKTEKDKVLRLLKSGWAVSYGPRPKNTRQK
ncbi:MAG: hypothetical protein PHD95_00350 [Candidatus ainarchaeum sp.]|nr:hypothetical protein [Candidatus ainarchaeum sp.]